MDAVLEEIRDPYSLRSREDEPQDEPQDELQDELQDEPREARKTKAHTGPRYSQSLLTAMVKHIASNHRTPIVEMWEDFHTKARLILWNQ